MHAFLRMDWPSRLVWGLLAWPVMISLAILLSSAADIHRPSSPWIVALVSVAEILVGPVAVAFPIWAFATWAQRDDDPGAGNRP